MLSCEIGREFFQTLILRIILRTPATTTVRTIFVTSCVHRTDFILKFFYYSHGFCFPIALPEEGVKIEGLKQYYTVGEYLEANCTAKMTFPAAQITWYINNIEVSTNFSTLFAYVHQYPIKFNFPIVVNFRAKINILYFLFPDHKHVG